MLLSIVIPVYNSEKYIERCLKSITATFKEKLDKVEIIFIENGSTDNTKELLNKYQKEYKYIFLESKKGVSIARNKGIDSASGKYIMFLDCDDILAIEDVEKFFYDLNNDSDIYIYNFLKTKNTKSYLVKHSFDGTIEDFIKWILEKPTLRCAAWSKIYKKEIIKKNNIYFREDLNYAEDSEFVLRYIKKIKNFQICNYTMYNYFLSDSSAMRSVNPKRIGEYLKSLAYTIEEYDCEKYKKDLSKYVLCHLNIIMVHDIFVYDKKIGLKSSIQKFKNVYRNSLFKKYIKNIGLFECFNKELIVEFFLKLKLNIFAYFLCYLKSYINQKK